LTEVDWPKPDLVEFHLKLVAAAAAGLADPISIVDAQRRELLRRLRDSQRRPWPSPTRRLQGCCSKALYYACRQTCDGSKRASGSGPGKGGNDERALGPGLPAPHPWALQVLRSRRRTGACVDEIDLEVAVGETVA